MKDVKEILYKIRMNYIAKTQKELKNKVILVCIIDLLEDIEEQKHIKKEDLQKYVMDYIDTYFY